MDTHVCQMLAEIVGASAIKYNELMSLHTTFKVGGPADVFITPPDVQSLVDAIALCRENHIPFYVIGNGSNLLVGDLGIRGVVFQIFHTLDHIEFDVQDDGSTFVLAGAGVMLSKLAREIAGRGLADFEFASGIPGTFGGAVAMNAGAYGGEIAASIVSVKVLDQAGRVFMLSKEELQPGYRTSAVLTNAYIVLEAVLKLYPGDIQAIKAKIEELGEMRRTKQPLEFPSAGSTFKRPEGYFAGKLIQDAGLKGYRIGGACVSEKHSGFIVNDRNGTARDILTLIRSVQKIVNEKFHVNLEPEVRIIGEFKSD